MGLSGKDETPTVTMKGDGGERLILELLDKRQLENYALGEIVTVKIVKEQQTL